MTFQHQELSQGRWEKLSFFEQMANIGSEVGRAINWRKKGSQEDSCLAFERALELIDLTLADARNRQRLREISRIRESWADYFVGENQYLSSGKSWKNYFYGFALAAKRN